MNPTKQHQKISKFLSFVLRHKPEAINLELNDEGWANIAELIQNAANFKDTPLLSQELIRKVVTSSDKQRFIISKDGLLIRANQGHSINVDLQLKAAIPPELLYHGTATRFLDKIMQEGLKPMQRQHVHLTEDKSTAKSVGIRYGKPIILEVNAFLMYEQGAKFFLSENGVWLTKNVSPIYITNK